MNDYCITNGRSNVCRIVLGRAERFEVWSLETKVCLKGFATAAEAKDYAVREGSA